MQHDSRPPARPALPTRACLLVALAFLSSTTACRLTRGEAACERNGDCPESLPRCAGATDGGIGVCEEAPDGGREDGGARGVDAGTTPAADAGPGRDAAG